MTRFLLNFDIYLTLYNFSYRERFVIPDIEKPKALNADVEMDEMLEEHERLKT